MRAPQSFKKWKISSIGTKSTCMSLWLFSIKTTIVNLLISPKLSLFCCQLFSYWLKGSEQSPFLCVTSCQSALWLWKSLKLWGTKGSGRKNQKTGWKKVCRKESPLTRRITLNYRVVQKIMTKRSRAKNNNQNFSYKVEPNRPSFNKTLDNKLKTNHYNRVMI